MHVYGKDVWRGCVLCMVPRLVCGMREREIEVERERREQNRFAYKSNSQHPAAAATAAVAVAGFIGQMKQWHFSSLLLLLLCKLPMRGFHLPTLSSRCAEYIARRVENGRFSDHFFFTTKITPLEASQGWLCHRVAHLWFATGIERTNSGVRAQGPLIYPRHHLATEEPFFLRTSGLIPCPKVGRSRKRGEGITGKTDHVFT